MPFQCTKISGSIHPNLPNFESVPLAHFLGWIDALAHTCHIAIGIIFDYTHELVVNTNRLPEWLSWLERCTRIAGPQVRFLTEAYSCIFRNCSWLGDIYKIKYTQISNFHLDS